MDQIAIAIGEENQPVALVYKGFSDEVDAKRLQVLMRLIEILHRNRQMPYAGRLHGLWHILSGAVAFRGDDFEHRPVRGFYKIIAGVSEIDMKSEMLHVPVSERLRGRRCDRRVLQAFEHIVEFSNMIEVECPCCQAKLKIDVETRAVITHTVPEKPKLIEDLAAEVAKLKGAEGRRDEVFRKQVEAQKSHGSILNKKFDELLKQAKENPDAKPVKRLFDLD
jgi:hypothetical protein